MWQVWIDTEETERTGEMKYIASGRLKRDAIRKALELKKAQPDKTVHVQRPDGSGTTLVELKPPRRSEARRLRLLAATVIVQKEQARLSEILAAADALGEITGSHPVLSEIAWRASMAKLLREQQRVIARAERIAKRAEG